MDIKKTVSNIANRVGGQVAGHFDRQLDKIDLTSVLSSFGVELIKHRRSLALPLIAAFSGGVAVGALLAPMSGKELRTKLMAFANSLKKSGDDSARELTSDGKPVASPYEDAKAERDQLDAEPSR